MSRICDVVFVFGLRSELTGGGRGSCRPCSIYYICEVILSRSQKENHVPANIYYKFTMRRDLERSCEKCFLPK